MAPLPIYYITLYTAVLLPLVIIGMTSLMLYEVKRSSATYYSYLPE